MGNQRRRSRTDTWRSRGRQFLLLLGKAASVLLAFTLLGTVYETVAEDSDRSAYPPPGQLVDVGGHRLHIHCVGEGSPTVVIDTGLGDWSASWRGEVQPEVARTTRVCTYDRAGLGYSESGQLPRTAERFAQELHTLLHCAEVPGPYVLVGHSLGGLTVRIFGDMFAQEVAGVVLIESMGPGRVRSSSPTTLPEVGPPFNEDWLLTLPARIGLLRALAGPLQFSAGLAPEVADSYIAFSVTPKFIQATVDESKGIAQGLARASAVDSLGSLPLIVVSRGSDQKPDWHTIQTDLLDLSTQGQQVIADKSGHNVHLDQPEAAVRAIVQMVEQIRLLAGHTPDGSAS